MLHSCCANWRECIPWHRTRASRAGHNPAPDGANRSPTLYWRSRMKRTWKLLTVPLASLVFVNACATKGALRNVEQRVANQEAALEQERNERMAADQRLAADLAQLRTD